MEKLFEARFVEESEYNSLKELFTLCFEDSIEAVNAFFEKTVSPERVVAIFDGNKAISSLYLLESDILIDGVSHNAYYVYGVCTHPDYRNKGLMKKLFHFTEKLVKERNIDYLFLVPAEEYLFDVYSKFGFKKGIYYKEETVSAPTTSGSASFCENVSFDSYKAFCLERSKNGVNIASLKESTFKSFFTSCNGEATAIQTEKGYCVFENNDGKVTVFEIYGDEKELLNIVFEKTKVTSLVCRFPADDINNSKAYGMYKPFGASPEIENAFFGIPYST